MNTYQITYYPPMPSGMTSEPPPVIVTGLQAADVQLDDHGLAIVDTNRNILFFVPWYLNPVVWLTATG